MSLAASLMGSTSSCMVALGWSVIGTLGRLGHRVDFFFGQRHVWGSVGCLQVASAGVRGRCVRGTGEG
jgi:hypothetical protein